MALTKREEKNLQIFILAGYGAFTLILFFGGTLHLYLHQRLHWYIVGSSALLFIMTKKILLPHSKSRSHSKIHSPSKSQSRKHSSYHPHKHSFLTYAVFLIPLFFAIFVPPDVTQFDISSTRMVTTSDITLEKAKDSTTQNQEGLQPVGTINMTTGEFWKHITRAKNNPAYYHGARIVISGFVFRSDQMEDADFAITRIQMSCCLADGRPLGFFAKHHSPELLESNQWYLFEGTLDTSGDELLIIVSSFKEIDPPRFPYAY